MEDTAGGKGALGELSAEPECSGIDFSQRSVTGGAGASAGARAGGQAAKSVPLAPLVK